MRVLKNVEGIAFTQLSAKDIVRHPLVQKIVEASEVYEEQENKKNRMTGRKASGSVSGGGHRGDNRGKRYDN